MKSISNNKLTLLRKLNRKKYRQEEHLFFVEGRRAVEQMIINNQLKLTMLCFDDDRALWEQQPWSGYTQQYAAKAMSIDSGIYQEVTDTDTPQGVLAVFEQPEPASVDTLINTSGLIVALDGLQDPGNLGTIIRTAAWFGLSGLILGKGTVDQFNPKVVRSTAGSTGSVPYLDGELPEIVQSMSEDGWEPVLLADQPMSENVRERNNSSKQILVIGNEAHGISDELRSSGYPSVRIPHGGDHQSVESLNASIAAGIAIFALTT